MLGEKKVIDHGYAVLLIVPMLSVSSERDEFPFACNVTTSSARADV